MILRFLFIYYLFFPSLFNRKQYGWFQSHMINDHTSITFDEPTQPSQRRHFSITFATSSKSKAMLNIKTKKAIDLLYTDKLTMIEYDGYWIEFTLSIDNDKRQRVWIRCQARHNMVIEVPTDDTAEELNIQTYMTPTTSQYNSSKRYYMPQGIILTAPSFGLCRWYHETPDRIIDNIPIMYGSSIPYQEPIVVSPSSGSRCGRDIEFLHAGTQLSYRVLGPIPTKVRQQCIEWLPHDIPILIIDMILVYSWSEHVLFFGSSLTGPLKFLKNPITWKHMIYDDIMCYVQVRMTKPAWILITIPTGVTYATRIPGEPERYGTIPTSTIEWPIDGVVLTAQSKQFRITLSFQISLPLMNATEVIMEG
jgi:hypothetical protein